MKISRRQVSIIGAVFVFLLVLGYAFMPRPVPVEVARVQRGPLRVTVDEDGRTRIRERYVISAPLAGELRRVELEPGDSVVAGRTVIAVIEPNPPELIDARTRRLLEARLRTAETQLRLAHPRIERARAAQTLAELEFQRVQALSRENAVAPQELDRAREVARMAAEDVRSAEYARQIAGFELEQAQAAMARVEPGRPDDCAWEMRLVSPVDGRVLRVFHEDAAVVPAGERLLEIGDPADLEIEIDVLSMDAVRIAPGAMVWVEHWGGPKPLEARVRLVEPAGFLKISALGVEEQRVNVIADFTSPPDQRRTLGDAYRVEARIVVWQGEDVIKAPVGALFRTAGEWSVFLVREGRARLMPVEVGHSDGREMEIGRGLQAGDAVVLHASDKVSDDVAVRVRAERR